MLDCADVFPVQSQPAPIVLVIDDDESVRVTISLSLAASGYRVLTADSPAQGQCVWNQRNAEIDLLVVDITMPTMSGPQLVRELFQRGPNLPVVFITGLSASVALEAAKNIPDSIILQKPFTPRALLEAMNNQLAKVAA